MKDNNGFKEKEAIAYADQSIIPYMPFRIYIGLVLIITGLTIYLSSIS